MSELTNDNLHPAESKDFNQAQKLQENVETTNRILEEIHQENAEDAEDSEKSKRHEIPFLDYEAMSMEKLSNELKKLLHSEKVQAIKKHAEAIKHEFDRKYEALLEEKKEEFIADGGESYDFKYESPVHRTFYALFNEYREKRNRYHRELEKIHHQNLIERQEIIEEIKNLINIEENINTTFKHFQQLQERWRKAGAVSHKDYDVLWGNYHHHVENFYDFIDLSRDLRDIDFKRNLEEKRKIIKKAQELAKEEVDAMRASRELQLLHKVWKEDIGPVAREYREEIWQQFSEATKAIHEKKQFYFANLDKVFEQNAQKKTEIIEKIKELASREFATHGAWQKAIKEMETLRETFLNLGRVPAHSADEIWKKFNESARSFNRKKNSYYKKLKKEQQENLEKKMALLEIAKANKNSEDWQAVTPVMKKIQEDWKQIGNVPRKNADKLWREFQKVCNEYFNALGKAIKNNQNKEFEVLEKKKNFLDKVKEHQLTADRDKEIEILQGFVNQWNELGKVPLSKKSIDTKFHKIIDGFYRKLNFDKQEIELLKYNNKLEKLANDEDENSLSYEMIFVRRKIDELTSEILQLENNLQFFSNVDEKNPLLRDVIKNITAQKETLETWKAKLHELKQLHQSQADEEQVSE
ncbi:DUF349 domain-containing protein [Capnocytophaga sp.]|uniref:DUF349 domain-containing protein n=1 Tax=Capnocytophaga sp. TaxID=44737 RepID=UPI0026DDB314|nr:DUF349 domain-containing protein [Capnocytophaga sp.]MDO5104781.1 DUF349 domain-containing protein [Capnocytophaga sp.]